MLTPDKVISEVSSSSKIPSQNGGSSNGRRKSKPEFVALGSRTYSDFDFQKSKQVIKMYNE